MGEGRDTNVLQASGEKEMVEVLYRSNRKEKPSIERCNIQLASTDYPSFSLAHLFFPSSPRTLHSTGVVLLESIAKELAYPTMTCPVTGKKFKVRPQQNEVKGKVESREGRRKDRLTRRDYSKRQGRKGFSSYVLEHILCHALFPQSSHFMGLLRHLVHLLQESDLLHLKGGGTGFSASGEVEAKKHRVTHF